MLISAAKLGCLTRYSHDRFTLERVLSGHSGNCSFWHSGVGFTFQPRRLLLVVAWDLWNVHWHFVIRLLSALASHLGLCVANLGIHLINVTHTQKNLVLFSSTYTVNISPFLVLALTVTLEVNSVQLKKNHTLEALVYLLWFSQHLWIITSCCDQRCIQNMFRHENMNLIYHHKLNELNDFAI